MEREIAFETAEMFSQLSVAGSGTQTVKRRTNISIAEWKISWSIT